MLPSVNLPNDGCFVSSTGVAPFSSHPWRSNAVQCMLVVSYPDTSNYSVAAGLPVSREWPLARESRMWVFLSLWNQRLRGFVVSLLHDRSVIHSLVPQEWVLTFSMHCRHGKICLWSCPACVLRPGEQSWSDPAGSPCRNGSSAAILQHPSVSYLAAVSAASVAVSVI